MVHEAVLNACDALDGVKDGVLENPGACKFDPKVLECKGPDGPTCLTAPQVETMRQLYAPMKLGNAGTVPPLLQPGTELGWATLAGTTPLELARDTMKNVVFKDPAWEISRFNPARDYDLAMLADSDKVLSLSDPNLKPYFDRGGKLLVYHGWSDPQVPAQSTVRVLQRRAEDHRQQERRHGDSTLYGAGHGSLPGRSGHGHVRQDGRASNRLSPPARRRRKSSRRT